MARVKLQDADLDGAQLQEADLKNAQLDRAELPTAQLQGADLENASLLGAVLTQANLRGANLRGARLKLADLSEADIEGADLSGANLSGARLRGAKLRGTLLCGATIHKADFDGTNLDQANLCAAADHPLAEEMGFIPRVCFGQCCLREVDPSGRQCKYEVHPSASPEYLVTLACRDAYTARGLSKQALRAERSGLASDLLTKASDADCPGVRLLPIRTLAELRRHPANAESR
jgi:hypothetical protein